MRGAKTLLEKLSMGVEAPVAQCSSRALASRLSVPVDCSFDAKGIWLWDVTGTEAITTV